jgi:hypothetical protein
MVEHLFYTLQNGIHARLPLIRGIHFPLRHMSTEGSRPDSQENLAGITLLGRKKTLPQYGRVKLRQYRWWNG